MLITRLIEEVFKTAWGTVTTISNHQNPEAIWLGLLPSSLYSAFSISSSLSWTYSLRLAPSLLILLPPGKPLTITRLRSLSATSSSFLWTCSLHLVPSSTKTTPHLSITCLDDEVVRLYSPWEDQYFRGSNKSRSDFTCLQRPIRCALMTLIIIDSRHIIHMINISFRLITNSCMYNCLFYQGADLLLKYRLIDSCT